MPASMAATVNSSLNHYFELWLKCGCAWGNVMIHEERMNKETSAEDQDYDWMYGFDVKKTFPPEIAAGWIVALKKRRRQIQSRSTVARQ